MMFHRFTYFRTRETFTLLILFSIYSALFVTVQITVNILLNKAKNVSLQV